MAKVVFISDTHTREPIVPPGDVLVHCGDMTGNGSLAQLQKVAAWLASHPHAHKVAISGNHDWCLYREEQRAAAERILREAGIVYLCDTLATVGGLTFYGSPWTPEFCGWAFMREEHDLKRIYASVPHADVLVTHGPPRGIRDESSAGHPCGSSSLREAVERTAPLVHAFGHIHEGHGTERHGPTLFVNAAICDIEYQPSNAPVVVEVGAKGPAAVAA